MNATATHPFAALMQNPPALPTIRDEEWRFTPLKAVTSHAWQPAPAAKLAKLDAPDLGGARVVFVNGRLEALSRLNAPGLAVTREVPPLRLADTTQPFVALNAAATQGVTLRVARGARLEAPVQIVYAGTEGAAFTRVALELEDGAELAVSEHYCGTGRHFLGSVTEAQVGTNASLRVARVVYDSAEAAHVSHFAARLARDARLTLDSIALEAAFARNEIRVTLDGEGAHAELRGLAVAHGQSLFDHQVLVDHARPHASSNQVFRNVLDDRSRGVFSGRVIVRPGAVGTDARQQNNNLLLSDDARIDTKPMLEIYTDDVKCSHGATSGQLDPGAVFFLRSRGLRESQARALLTWAFAKSIVDQVGVGGLRGPLAAALATRLSFEDATTGDHG